MKFTEAQLEQAFIELLQQKDIPHSGRLHKPNFVACHRLFLKQATKLGLCR